MEASLLIRLIDQVTGPAQKVRGALRGIRDTAGEFGRAFGDEIRKGFSVENIEQSTKNAEAALQRARGRLLGAFGMAMSLAAPIVQAGRFDQSMRGLDKVLDVSEERLRSLRNFALSTSAMVPVAARELVELMAEAAQGGVPEAELEAFTLYVSKAAVAFDMAGGEIGNRFAKLRNVYKLNQAGIEDLGDATNHLSNNMAAKASELTDFTNRAAGAAAIFRLTATQTAAVGAAMIAAGVVPETAARGFTALATRILSGSKKIDGAFATLGMNRKQFLKDLQDDAPAALERLFTTMAKSEDGMEALIELVGRDFADDFAKFLGNPELLAQAFAMVAEKAKYAGSATDEAAKQAQGAEKKWALLLGKLTRISIVLGDALLPTIVMIGDKLGAVADRVAAFAEAHPQLTQAIVMTLGALLALSIGVRVLSFLFSGARLSLIRLLGFFLRFDKEGRNIAAGWRLLAGAFRFVLSPLRLLRITAGGLVSVLTRLVGLKAAPGLLGWLTKLAGLAGGLAAVRRAVNGIRPPRAPGGMTPANDNAAPRAARAPVTGFTLARTAALGLNAIAIVERFLGLNEELADSQKKIEAEMAKGKTRAEAIATVSAEQSAEVDAVAKWVDDTVGSPRSWFGLAKPKDPAAAAEEELANRRADAEREASLDAVIDGPKAAVTADGNRPGVVTDMLNGMDKLSATYDRLDAAGRSVADGGQDAGGALKEGAAALRDAASQLSGVASRLGNIKVSAQGGPVRGGVGGAISAAKNGALHDGVD